VLFKAAQAADYPLMSAIFLLITVLVLLANLAADIAYVFLDPRTRES
jgi:peptide/nickel transport system permease protein